MKARTIDGGKKLWIECPACDAPHVCRLDTGFQESPKWSWDGSTEAPTLQPSILVRWTEPSGDKVCHSFVTDGMIQFLGDCTHALAGQTVPLLEIQEPGSTP